MAAAPPPKKVRPGRLLKIPGVTIIRRDFGCPDCCAVETKPHPKASEVDA